MDYTELLGRKENAILNKCYRLVERKYKEYCNEIVLNDKEMPDKIVIKFWYGHARDSDDEYENEDYKLAEIIHNNYIDECCDYLSNRYNIPSTNINIKAFTLSKLLGGYNACEGFDLIITFD